MRNAAAAVLIVLATGCARPENPAVGIDPIAPGYSYAVAPALNFSGAAELDPLRVADLFASELASVRGLTILPVSRTVAALAREGRLQVESPAHAVGLAERVGADAIIVLGITEYDPYTPIVVGLAAQVYARNARPDSGSPAADGQDKPFAVLKQGSTFLMPVAQVQRVYNGAHADLAERIRKYAELRNADKSPYGWRRYMVSQELFLRFCCWDAAARLMEQERSRTWQLANASGRFEDER